MRAKMVLVLMAVMVSGFLVSDIMAAQKTYDDVVKGCPVSTGSVLKTDLQDGMNIWLPAGRASVGFDLALESRIIGKDRSAICVRTTALVDGEPAETSVVSFGKRNQKTLFIRESR